jgi:pectate lyase
MIRSREIGIVVALSGSLVFFISLASATSPVWKEGQGNWTDAARWGGTVPEATGIAAIEGNSKVVLSRGDVSVSQLDIGSFHDARASMTMDGGTLTLSKLLRIGEVTGAAGSFIQTGGNIRALEICIAAANLGNGIDRKATGELEVRGGSILTRHLTLGWGAGSTARLHVVGSAAAPVLVLDYLWIGVRQKDAAGSAIELSYDIDAGGVTPIVVWNKEASPVALIDDAARSTCRLRLSLRAAPPVGDIPLLRMPKPCHGTFTGLAEGSKVRATFGDENYEWTLTYHGGAAKTDVVLTDPQKVSSDGQRSPYKLGKPAKPFVVTADDVNSGLREMARSQETLLKPVDPAAPRAFPGAEGYGAFAKGGRGGRVLFVTNLDDAGPGSLRAAISAAGPRTVIFRVGGVIQLRSALNIREPYLTIAGQTAPGEGICIRGDSGMHADGLVLNQTHDVVVRYLRVQLGKGPQEAKPDDGGDCISAYDSRNFIIDHCSTHWGSDETLSASGAVDLYTIQWCVISEALNYEKHSMSSILCGDRCTWHHNLFAHSGSRNPLFAGQTRCDFRNNVIYDWGHTSGQGNFTQLNYVGNYLRPGPSTVQNPLRFIGGDGVAMPASLHVAGNIMDGSAELSRDNWLGVFIDRASGSDHPLPMLPLPTESAEDALRSVLKKVGAVVPRRDAADSRIIADVENRTGKIVESQQEVGGWPEYAGCSTTAVDSDNDGIPDKWEKEHGLNPNDPADANATAGGYTKLEDYLNELATLPVRTP